MHVALAILALLPAMPAFAAERQPRTLEEFLGKDAGIIRRAESVTAFRVEDPETVRRKLELVNPELIDGYVLLERRVLPDELAAKVKAAVLDAATYHLDCNATRADGPLNPTIAFRFESGKSSRDVFVSFTRAELALGDPSRLEKTTRRADVVPGHAKLISLAIEAFPQDSTFKYLRDWFDRRGRKQSPVL